LANDRRSIDRNLPHSMFLLVKRNRDDHSWQFPQGKINETETARQVI
jgi:8-oxo-dGTP pyrophosphatase MutT (NUDIX family)